MHVRLRRTFKSVVAAMARSHCSILDERVHLTLAPRKNPGTDRALSQQAAALGRLRGIPKDLSPRRLLYSGICFRARAPGHEALSTLTEEHHVNRLKNGAPVQNQGKMADVV